VGDCEPRTKYSNTHDIDLDIHDITVR
jgi:hypothetical protein